LRSRRKRLKPLGGEMIHRVLRPSRPEIRPGPFGARAVLFALVLVPWATTCTPVAMPSARQGPVAVPIPSIEEGTLPPPMEAEAERTLQDARNQLVSGRFVEARDLALDVILHYPGAAGSGEALEILARAALGLGRAADAVEAAGRYLALLEPSQPAYPGAVLLQSQALVRNGDPTASFQTLILIPPGAPPATMSEATGLLREVAGRVGTATLREVARDSPPSHPFRGVLATELAASLFLSGERAEAEVWARAALAGGLEPREEEISQGVLDGRLEEILGQPMILGAILPRSGVSPSLIEYGEGVFEGIQVAVEEFQGELRRPIHLEVQDHGGDPEGGRISVRSLEELGAFGAVGPLTRDVLGAAAAARERGLPLVSPFAFLPLEEAPGVLSLSGPDPAGADLVARYAWELGLERVVVLRPRTEEARIEASAFQETFRTLGGRVPREIVYDSGATFYQTEFDQVGSLLPDGLFLPLSPSDIQLLAPQFTYFGLDTLGIQLLGTTGWSEDEVVLDVDSRHTDGVIASTTRMSQDETESFRRFRSGYETLFRKTLRDRVPAYGYDAASILLEALRSNPRSSRELLQAMNGIQDYPGATGVFSVVGGRIIRQPGLVRIQNHELIYISPRFD
ncbi:MAG: ABC transporter substrate-binding protein, partial [Gemmatimonadota bacterium]